MGLELLEASKYREKVSLRLTQKNIVLREGQRPHPDVIVCEPLDPTISEGRLNFSVI